MTADHCNPSTRARATAVPITIVTSPIPLSERRNSSSSSQVTTVGGMLSARERDEMIEECCHHNHIVSPENVFKAHEKFEKRKLVVVGDGGIGKTCLLAHYTTGKYLSEYVPTVFKNENCFVRVKDKLYELATRKSRLNIEGTLHNLELAHWNNSFLPILPADPLELWDTAGQEDYARLRPLSYVDASTFLLCFALDSPDSFANIQTKWILEIHHYAPNAPIVLVGLKSDLRVDYDDLCLNMQRGIALVEAGIVEAYVECSALTGHNIEGAIEKGILHARGGKPEKKTRKSCKMM